MLAVRDVSGTLTDCVTEKSVHLTIGHEFSVIVKTPSRVLGAQSKYTVQHYIVKGALLPLSVGLKRCSI